MSNRLNVSLGHTSLFRVQLKKDGEDKGFHSDGLRPLQRMLNIHFILTNCMNLPHIATGTKNCAGLGSTLNRISYNEQFNVKKGTKR